MLSVILPAHDESAIIADCLEALAASTGVRGAEVIVIANGCSDDTAARARGLADRLAAQGWRLQVIVRAEAGKPGALNAGDKAASGGIRVYLDADVQVSPGLLAALAAALDVEMPRLASGTIRITAPRNRVSRAYARAWRRTPFMSGPVPAAGLFAVNAAGRARWQDWPEIISDDTFARLHFAPCERIAVPETYDWPVVAGLANLVRARRRQNRGVAQIAELYPGLLRNADSAPMPPGDALRLGLRDPGALAAYGAVALWVRLTRGLGGTRWRRGR